MKSIRICIQDIRKWRDNTRIKMCFLLVVLFVMSYTAGLRALSLKMDIDMTPWIFPFMFTWRYMKIIYMIPVVFIFCDAPFVDSNQMYVIIRSKRKSWCAGQILYIFAGSFIYTALLLLSSIIVNIKYMQWDTRWGEVLGTASTTNIMQTIGQNYTTVKVSTIIVRYYTPLQAMIYTFLLMWLSMTMIGLLIYIFNVFTKTRFAGNLVAAFLILLTAVVDGKPLLTWLSPMSWNSLNNIDVAGITKYPTIIYVLFMYLMIIGISIFLILFIGKKQEIIVQEER